MPTVVNIGGRYVKAYTFTERTEYLKKFLELRSKGLSGTAASRRVGVSYKALRRWEKSGMYVIPVPKKIDASECLRADNQQFLALGAGRVPKGTLRLVLPSGNVLHGTPKALTEVLHLLERD